MNYDFQSVIERRGTGCIKYDRRPDLDPFWVADMDFVSAPEILEALHRRVDHGVFGYAQAHAGLIDSILAYLADRHRTRVEESEVVHLGGLVPALSLACRSFAKPGDSVLTCTPVYPPFLGVHKDARLDLHTVPHVRNDRGAWSFDWDGLEMAVTPRTRLFLLCHPQNPLGRVFPPAEIQRLAEFCRRHDLVLVSDEIHCDLVLDEEATPFISALHLPEHFHDRLVVLLAPSKTWNIAGLGYSFAVIRDDSLRRRFAAARGHTLPEINALAYYAAEAAYRHGEPWRQALLATLRDNSAILAAFIAEQTPALRHDPGDATYLAWIDASALHNMGNNPARYFEESTKLFVSDGTYFGVPDHVRFNFGCPRSRLLDGLEKLSRAVRNSH